MPTVNRTRLLNLSEREFRREADAPERAPASQKFRPIRLALSKYGNDWDRKRGSAARLMAVLLRESDDQLTGRVCEDDNTSRTYRGAADWLAGEARYLRKLAGMMDTAAGRLGVTLQRCGHSSTPAAATAAGSQS